MKEKWSEVSDGLFATTDGRYTIVVNENKTKFVLSDTIKSKMWTHKSLADAMQQAHTERKKR